MILACPVCASTDTVPVVTIPQVPVHCNLLLDTPEKAEEIPRGNLDLKICLSCGHLFNQAYDANMMQYSQEYENALHFSPAFQEYAEKLARSLIDRWQLFDKDIIEIGCGDGHFLKQMCSMGRNRGIGFDPGYSGDEDDDERIQVIQDFYSEKYAGVKGDLIVCRQMLEHLEEPGVLLQWVRKSIGDRQTVVFFEVPNGQFILQQFRIWDLIFEHPSYFSPASLVELFRRFGFEVLDLKETFGNQFLTIEAAPGSDQKRQQNNVEINLNTLLQDVQRFRQRFQEEILKWQLRLEKMENVGIRAVLWGAGSKGVSFLNLVSITEQIEYVIDINPRKWGKFIAGRGQMIQPPEFLRFIRPEVVIITNENYRSEIAAYLSELKISAEIFVA